MKKPKRSRRIIRKRVNRFPAARCRYLCKKIEPLPIHSAAQEHPRKSICLRRLFENTENIPDCSRCILCKLFREIGRHPVRHGPRLVFYGNILRRRGIRKLTDTCPVQNRFTPIRILDNFIRVRSAPFRRRGNIKFQQNHRVRRILQNFPHCLSDYIHLILPGTEPHGICSPAMTGNTEIDANSEHIESGPLHCGSLFQITGIAVNRRCGIVLINFQRNRNSVYEKLHLVAVLCNFRINLLAF